MKVKLTKLPTLKIIQVRCPGCKKLIERALPKNQIGASFTCALCMAEFDWEE